MSSLKVTKEMVLTMLESNRYLVKRLNESTEALNVFVVTEEGIQYSVQSPGIEGDKGLFVSFDEINQHLEGVAA